jgi:hypothetical protein
MSRAALSALCAATLTLAACASSRPSSGRAPASGSGTTPLGRDGSAVRAAFADIQDAVRTRDAKAMCALLWPQAAERLHGPLARIEAEADGLDRSCGSSFGRRGEFSAYARLLKGASVRRVETTDSLAVVSLNTTQGSARVRFLSVAGRWRLLVPSDR